LQPGVLPDLVLPVSDVDHVHKNIENSEGTHCFVAVVLTAIDVSGKFLPIVWKPGVHDRNV
jgi:hypothetical protein